MDAKMENCYKAVEIFNKLLEAEIKQSGGMPPPDTCYRWRNEYGDLSRVTPPN